jgi:hypothetical protein
VRLLHQRRARLHEVGVLRRVGEFLGVDEVAADLLREAAQDRERRHHLQLLAAGPHRRGQRRRGAREEARRHGGAARDRLRQVVHGISLSWIRRSWWFDFVIC